MAKVKDEEMEDEFEDTLTWVNRSRQRQELIQQQLERKKKLAEQKKKSLDSQDHSLKGVKVSHEFGEFQEGESVILTLKDSYILGDNYKFNDEEDELENYELAEKNKIQENKKKATTKYNPINELNKSNEESSSRITILTKYDEKEAPKGIVLEGEHTSGKSKEERLQAIRSKLNSSLKKSIKSKVLPSINLKYNLNDDQFGFSNEGGSNNNAGDETAMRIIPNAPKAVFKKRKKISKNGGKEKASTGSNPLLAELLSEISTNENNEEDEDDYGSRNAGSTTQTNDSIKQKIEKQKRVDAYSKALTKAKKVSLSLLNDGEGLFHDDNELFDSIQNNRKKFNEPKVSQKELLESSKQKWKERELSEIQLMNSNDPTIFTTTREFCRNIASQKKDEENPLKMEIVDNQPEVKVEEGVEEEEEEKMEIQKPDHHHPVAVKEPIIDEEPDVSEGIFSALKLFEKRNVSSQKDKEMFLGKKGDKPLVLENDPAPFLNLEHRDEYGRVLSQKEIFRKLSHKFHGKTPGKNKLEKNLKKFKEELKLRNMSYDDTPLNTVQKMRTEQERTGLAYVELSGNASLSSSVSSKPSDKPSLPAKAGHKVEFSIAGKRKDMSSSSSQTPVPNKKVKF